jgi:hypothetical protein
MGSAMVLVDPVVRSIRVAVALNEQFRDLLTAPGPTTVSSSVMGSSRAADALALRIGEAQQIAVIGMLIMAAS